MDVIHVCNVMYVCTYVCMYVMYVCIYVMYACMYVTYVSNTMYSNVCNVYAINVCM